MKVGKGEGKWLYWATFQEDINNVQESWEEWENLTHSTSSQGGSNIGQIIKGHKSYTKEIEFYLITVR